MPRQFKYESCVLRQIRLFVNIILIFSFSSLAEADTVKWAILPNYDYLEPYCDGVYKYVERGTMGLIDDSGVVIDGSQCDSITPASSNGLALMLCSVGTSEATLVGIFNCRKRQVIPVDDDLKVNLDFAFFSDDRLPVHDNDGNWGYLGIEGKLAIPCKYIEAWPFSMQRAPVRLKTKTKNVVYIKEDGTRITLFINDGFIGDGTPIFKDGTADVTLNGKHSRITRNGKVNKNRIDKSELRSIKDWLSEYRQSMAENVVLASALDSAMQFFLDSEDGQIISQQVKVLSTNGDQAIVGYKGKVGLLQLVQGDFSVDMASSQVTVKDQKVDPQILKMDVFIPDEINPQELSFYINDYRIEPTPKGNSSQELQFETSHYADLTSSITEDINVDVRDHHGLLLFKGDGKISITYKKPDPKPDPPIPEQRCNTCGALKSICPHKGKHRECKSCHKIIDKGHRVKDRCLVDGRKHPKQKVYPDIPPT